MLFRPGVLLATPTATPADRPTTASMVLFVTSTAPANTLRTPSTRAVERCGYYKVDTISKKIDEYKAHLHDGLSDASLPCLLIIVVVIATVRTHIAVGRVTREGEAGLDVVLLEYEND